MLKLALEDMRLEGLQKIAGYYGIPVAGLDRDGLLDSIRQRMASGTDITLGEHSRAWWRTPSTIVAIIAVLIAASAMCANWYSIHRTVGKDIEQKQTDEIRQWQQVVVYSILEQGMKENSHGLTFDQIKSKYLEEATTVEGIDLKKAELQPLKLKRILTDLITLDQIYHTVENKYMLKNALAVEGLDRYFVMDRAKAHIANILAADPKSYTVEQLAQKVVQETGITRQEYNALIADLIASKTVDIDEQNRLFTKAFPRKTDDKKDK